MSDKIISKVYAREIIDCRGWPTVQADVWVNGQLMGRADVQAGRSTGSKEAHVLSDGDKNRYRSLGVLKAVENVNKEIGPLLTGMEVTDQRKIDMPVRGERTSKHNRLLQIEEELGSTAIYAGRNFARPAFRKVLLPSVLIRKIDGLH